MRETGSRQRVIDPVSWRFKSFCQTEVQHFRHAPRCHDDILRLHVTVNDAVHVRFCQRIGNLRAEINDPPLVQAFPLEQRRKRFALEELHHKKIDTLIPADIEQRANVRMIQRGDGLRFALEAALSVGIRHGA